MKTQIEKISDAFKCSPQQVESQLAKNRAQLLAMAAKARQTGGKVNSMSEIELRVAAEILGTAPKTAERNKALSGVKWVLRESCGLYAALDKKAAPALTTKNNALVFDGRDNETLKMAFYSSAVGGNFKPETL